MFMEMKKPSGFRLVLLFYKALAGLIFLNILFNQGKLLLNTLYYIPISLPSPALLVKRLGYFS